MNYRSSISISQSLNSKKYVYNHRDRDREICTTVAYKEFLFFFDIVAYKELKLQLPPKTLGTVLAITLQKNNNW